MHGRKIVACSRRSRPSSTTLKSATYRWLLPLRSSSAAICLIATGTNADDAKTLARLGYRQELRRMHDTGDYSISDLAELFSISRPTVYRTLGRIAGTVESDQMIHTRKHELGADTVPLSV